MHDALVIGAGPAGCAAALALARAGASVALLHAAERAAFAVGEALPPAACPVLASLALEPEVHAQGHRRAFGNRSAWGSDAIETTDFILHPFGHGWHLDRRAFDAGLREAARAAGARIVPGRLREVDGCAGAWRVRVDGNGDGGAAASVLRAGVVIDCSGRGAAFARRRGAMRVRRDRLVACVAMLEAATPEADADATTLVEATRDGWWYTARLPGGRRVVAFLSDGDLPASRGLRSLREFHDALARTRHVGAPCAAAGYAIAAPLRRVAADTGRLDHVAGDGWIAAGDAAMSFDPISSQGIMTALQCGQRAAAAVLTGRAGDYGDELDAVFERCEAARRAVYAQERRWADAPFWRRRQLPPARRSGFLGDQQHRAGLAG